jgi:hypothetical protein
VGNVVQSPVSVPISEIAPIETQPFEIRTCKSIGLQSWLRR